MPFDTAHALVIQITRYRFVGQLPLVHDAEDIASLLHDPTRCGYPVDNVEVLLEEEATLQGIRDGLARLANRTDSESTIFIYFSGHGGHIGSGEHARQFLLPIDVVDATEEQLVATALSGADFTRSLRELNARKVVVILDCCHAEGIATSKSIDTSKDIKRLTPGFSGGDLSKLQGGAGWVIIASSTCNEQSWVLPNARNGLFTKHLLAGLRGGVTTHEKVIRILDLYNYVQPRVTDEHPDQHPVLLAGVKENFPVALTPRPRESRRRVFVSLLFLLLLLGGCVIWLRIPPDSEESGSEVVESASEIFPAPDVIKPAPKAEQVVAIQKEQLPRNPSTPQHPDGKLPKRLVRKDGTNYLQVWLGVGDFYPYVYPDETKGEVGLAKPLQFMQRFYVTDVVNQTEHFYLLATCENPSSNEEERKNLKHIGWVPGRYLVHSNRAYSRALARNPEKPYNEMVGGFAPTNGGMGKVTARLSAPLVFVYGRADGFLLLGNAPTIPPYDGDEEAAKSLVGWFQQTDFWEWNTTFSCEWDHVATLDKIHRPTYVLNDIRPDTHPSKKKLVLPRRAVPGKIYTSVANAVAGLRQENVSCLVVEEFQHDKELGKVSKPLQHDSPRYPILADNLKTDSKAGRLFRVAVWRKINGVDYCEDGYVWENTSDGLPLIRLRVLVYRWELAKLSEKLDKVISDAGEAELRPIPWKWLEIPWRGGMNRTADFWQLKHVRDLYDDIMDEKLRKYELATVREGGVPAAFKYIRKDPDPEEVAMPRGFKRGTDGRVWYYLDYEKEWP